MSDPRALRKLILSGQLKLASEQLAGAFAQTPQQPELVQVLDQLNQLQPALIQENTTLRAIDKAQQGDADALRELAAVIREHRRAEFLLWWPAEAALSGDEVSSSALHALFDALIPALATASPQTPSSLEALLERLEPLIELALTYERAGLWCQCSALYRMLGRTTRALALAQAALCRWPGATSALCAARAQRAMGMNDGALESYELAKHDERWGIMARQEMADIAAARGDHEQAISLFREILDVDPTHSGARALLLYHRCIHEHDLHWRDELIEHAKLYPECHTSQQLVAQIAHRTDPYVGYLPAPGDSLINTLRDLPAPMRSTLPKTITLTYLEAPSAVMAFERTLAGWARADGAMPHLHIERVQQPDPRFPLAPVEHLLWSYDDTRAIPRRGQLPPSIATRLTDLALHPYDLQAWWQRAGVLGQSLGPDGIEALLLAMVQPPLCPHEAMPIWRWFQHIQVAAAMTIAQCESSWRGSRRKAALTSLLRGPTDWTTEAAILASSQLSLMSSQHPEAPEMIEDITSLCSELVRHISPEAYCCYEYALMCNMLRMPWLGPELRAQLNLWRQTLE